MEFTEAPDKDRNLNKTPRLMKNLRDFLHSDETTSFLLRDRTLAGEIDIVKLQHNKKTVYSRLVTEKIYFPELKYTKIKDARIYFPWHVIQSSDGEISKDLTIFSPDVEDMPFEKRYSVPGVSMVPTNNTRNNYFHWSAEVIPALVTLKNIESELISEEISYQYLYSALTGQYQLQYAQMPFVQHANVKWAESGLYELETLIYSSYSNHSRDRNVTWPKEIFDFASQIVNLAMKSGPAKRHSKIYVSRQDTGRRRCLSESLLEAELVKLGFEIVTLGGMSVFEQARVFHGADVIVALHGAGLTNMIFCSPGTLVVEAQSPHIKNSAFLRMSTINKLSYALYQEEDLDDLSEAQRSQVYNNDWTLDVDRFVQFVRECLI